MNKGQGQQDTTKELMGYLLPEGTMDYFEPTHIVKDKEGLVLFLEEKNLPSAEYNDQTLHSKGFLDPVRVQDFPIRHNKVELNIKRRRREVQTSGEIVSRNWDLVMYNQVEHAGIGSFRSVSKSIQSHYLGILNFISNRSTNASAGSLTLK